MNDDTASACIQIFRKVTGLDLSRRRAEISDTEILSNPIGSFEIDSLETMEFIMGIEDKFDVELDEEAVNRCSNVGELVGLVASVRNV